MNKHSKQINTSVNKSDYELFQKMYPNCLSRFIRSVIRLALADREFFLSVFFNQNIL